MARTTAEFQRPGLRPWFDLKGGPLVTDRVGDDFSSDVYPAYVRWRHRAMQQYNCWHEDRTAAGNGVEARVPFLDQEFIRLAMSIPQDLKYRNGDLKHLLKSALRGVLHCAGVSTDHVLLHLVLEVDKVARAQLVAQVRLAHVEQLGQRGQLFCRLGQHVFGERFDRLDRHR